MAALCTQHSRLQTLWPKVRISVPRTDRDTAALHVGDAFEAEAQVELGELEPQEVDVEVYYGPVNSRNEFVEAAPAKMEMAEELGKGMYRYHCQVGCRGAGRYGFTARVTPKGSDWRATIPGLITWAIES